MRQQVEGAGGCADLAGGDAQVSGSGREAAMAEQELNSPQISAGFEEMDGERVPKRVRGDGFGETRQTKGFLTGQSHGILRNRPIVTNAWEQLLLRAR
jgi:hypothetical protein